MPGFTVSYSTSDGAIDSHGFTAAEMKEHLRVTASETQDDGEILRLVKAAKEQIEAYTGRAMLKQLITLTLDSFPVGRDERLYLPRPPLISISSITYVDPDGTTQTFSSTAYRVSTVPTPGTVSPSRPDEWPSEVDYTIDDPITITYLAGHASNAAVPERIKQAQALTVGNWWENREGVVTGTIATVLPQNAKWLLDGLKIGHYPGLYRLRNEL